MPNYKTLNVDPKTYENILKLAKAEGRTIGGQVRLMTSTEMRRMRIREVCELPHPEGAEPVPLVVIERDEDDQNPYITEED